MDLINGLWEWLQGIPLWFLAAVVVPIVFSYAYRQLVATKCPNCGKRAALEKTGATGYVDEAVETLTPIQEDSFWSNVTQLFKERDEEQEWVCKYCQHRIWKEIPKSSGV